MNLIDPFGLFKLAGATADPPIIVVTVWAPEPEEIFSSGGINEGTVEHEALHNLTKLFDPQLQSRLGIIQNPNDTINITQALRDHHCAH